MRKVLDSAASPGFDVDIVAAGGEAVAGIIAQGTIVRPAVFL